MKASFTLLWWLLTFRSYKIAVCKYWEDSGMHFPFAFERAKDCTREEAKRLLRNGDRYGL